MFVGIYFRDEATRILENLNRQMDAVEDSVVGMGRQLVGAGRNIDRFGSAGMNATREVERGFEEAEDSAREFENGIGRATSSVDGLKRTLKNMVGIVAGVFAVDKIKNFGLDSIEAAAGFQAMDAQFEQVFSDAQQHASEGLNKIAKDTGMLPERLKGSFTQIAAFAKTTGADTADALSLTERATLAAADSAAFYDRSIEEVIENMQSFLKGNFENDAALGISATETTRNAKANELYGKSFIKLNESQKQLTLMAMVEDGNKLSGALGQAARESDAYENQLGNLKQSWMNLKGKIGGPLLQPFVDGMASASQWIENLDTDKLVGKIDHVVSFVRTAKDTFMSLVNDSGNVSDLWQKFGLPKETSDNIASFADTMSSTVAVGIDAASVAFDGFKTGVSWLIQNKELVIAATAGIAGGFAVMKTISFVKTALDLFKASTIASTFATQGFNAALRANPIGMVVTAVGLLISGGILLYQNWETVKTKAIQLWQVIDNNPILSFLAGPIKGLISAGITIYKNWDTITSNFNKFKNAITNFKVPKWVSSIGSTIGKAAGAVGNFISGSHATGLERVPYDGYVAELHKDESVLTANQSNMLRRAGILSQGSSGTPELNLDNNNGSATGIPQAINTDIGNKTNNSGGGNQFIFNISGTNAIDIGREVREIISDILDTEMQTT
ncbi:hypothetical protein U1P98_04460 [Lysinibacillus irui]|uniref:Phage tail tape measure protein n=1 Tax=Lysinibacillus irui TaxID=2998077 RepID=A0ABU5NHM1_9BACI|nr:hypothetical protein [Lysinibacillus irui]MEA0552962.1 hypothetical protein [Lysinibacillus irui]MEA0975542.1 hypothetical protein [Lysinibacillus irui]MEA1041696.1 hypothetical protein [Lysinibacillus irui]